MQLGLEIKLVFVCGIVLTEYITHQIRYDYINIRYYRWLLLRFAQVTN